MRRHTTDRNGRPAPRSSGRAYGSGSVTVPFGGCTEKSNVKAGGKACPIRFQCAGCTFYRPDPSYLPAVEDQIRSLRTEREMAVMMEVDEFVVRNFDDQIAAYKRVVDQMHQQLADMEPQERAEVQEASTVLRKMRATASGRGSVALPVPTFPWQREAEGEGA
jgi:hypothetical protein